MFEFVCVYVYIYVYIYIYMYVCMHICICVCMYVSMYIYMYIYVYIYLRQQHKQLAPFVKEGILDFALFDAANPQSHTHTKKSTHTTTTPIHTPRVPERKNGSVGSETPGMCVCM